MKRRQQSPFDKQASDSHVSTWFQATVHYRGGSRQCHKTSKAPTCHLWQRPGRASTWREVTQPTLECQRLSTKLAPLPAWSAPRQRSNSNASWIQQVPSDLHPQSSNKCPHRSVIYGVTCLTPILDPRICTPRAPISALTSPRQSSVRHTLEPNPWFPNIPDRPLKSRGIFRITWDTKQKDDGQGKARGERR